jgi:hypothetical protein
MSTQTDNNKQQMLISQTIQTTQAHKCKLQAQAQASQPTKQSYISSPKQTNSILLS